MATKHHIYHSFRDKIFVPMLAVSNNVDFLFYENDEKIVLMQDGILAKVKNWKTIHILSKEAEGIISMLYKIDVMTFLKKWYNSLPIETMEFLYIELEKYDGKGKDN
ncbi:MAG: hypothetical protein ACI4N3_04435 [Alphaproteobacteria bacterium]